MRYFSFFLMLSALWVTTATHSHFSQDSWSYYELSRHVFNDFYRINSWRQFHVISEYGVSFPPLWPVMIASLNTLLHIGIYAGFVINFVVAGCTFLLLRRMSKIWFEEKEIGCLIFFALMITPDYTTAIFSAGTLPLGLLLLLAVLYIHAAKRYTLWMKAVLLGIISGLAVLNRFDFLLPALMLGLFIRPLRAIFVYYITLAVTLLPWMGYSFAHFGVFWITDNSRTILSAVPLFVRDYYPHGVPLIWDNPLGWIKKTIGAMMKSTDVLFTATSALPWVFALTLLVARRPQMNKNITLFGALIVAQLISILLTGFVETRYYVPLQLFLLVLLLWLALPAELPAMLARRISAVLLLFSILYAGAYVGKSLVQSTHIGVAFNENNLQPKEFAMLQSCMGSRQKDVSILLPPKNYSYKFGALTGVTSYIEPTNMNSRNAPAFIAQFKPTYLLTATPEIYGLSSGSLCTLKGWGESNAVYRLYRL